MPIGSPCSCGDGSRQLHDPAALMHRRRSAHLAQLQPSARGNVQIQPINGIKSQRRRPYSPDFSIALQLDVDRGIPASQRQALTGSDIEGNVRAQQEPPREGCISDPHYGLGPADHHVVHRSRHPGGDPVGAVAPHAVRDTITPHLFRRPGAEGEQKSHKRNCQQEAFSHIDILLF